jgi:hypothetical protein
MRIGGRKRGADVWNKGTSAAAETSESTAAAAAAAAVASTTTASIGDMICRSSRSVVKKELLEQEGARRESRAVGRSPGRSRRPRLRILGHVTEGGKGGEANLSDAAVDLSKAPRSERGGATGRPAGRPPVTRSHGGQVGVRRSGGH